MCAYLNIRVARLQSGLNWLWTRWAFCLWVILFVIVVLYATGYHFVNWKHAPSWYQEKEFWRGFENAAILSTLAYGLIVYITLGLTGAGNIKRSVFSFMLIPLLVGHWLFLVCALLAHELSATWPNVFGDYSTWKLGYLLIAAFLIVVVDTVIMSPCSNANETMRKAHKHSLMFADLPIIIGFGVLFFFAKLILNANTADVERDLGYNFELPYHAFFAGAAALQMIFSSWVYALIALKFPIGGRATNAI